MVVSDQPKMTHVRTGNISYEQLFNLWAAIPQQNTIKSTANSEYRNSEREGEKESVTIASEEPSTDHWVISPFWILRQLVGDKGNSTSPAPVDMAETLILIEFGKQPDMMPAAAIGVWANGKNRWEREKKGRAEGAGVLRRVTVGVTVRVRVWVWERSLRNGIDAADEGALPNIIWHLIWCFGEVIDNGENSGVEFHMFINHY